MTALTPLAVLVDSLILLAGAGLTAVGFRAYQRTGATPLRSLTLGLGAVTAGGLLSGLDWLFATGTAAGSLAGDTLVAVGLCLLVHALYTRQNGIEARGRGASPP